MQQVNKHRVNRYKVAFREKWGQFGRQVGVESRKGNRYLLYLKRIIEIQKEFNIELVSMFF